MIDGEDNMLFAFERCDHKSPPRPCKSLNHSGTGNAARLRDREIQKAGKSYIHKRAIVVTCIRMSVNGAQRIFRKN
jgi:hypothetical protein